MGSVVPAPSFIKNKGSATKKSPLPQVQEDDEDGMKEISKQLNGIKPRYSPPRPDKKKPA